jgi:hypothetical protein
MGSVANSAPIFLSKLINGNYKEEFNNFEQILCISGQLRLL